MLKFYKGCDNMPCYHPLKGFPVGVNPSGKTKYKITSYDVDHIEYVGSSIRLSAEKGASPVADRVIRDFVDIPCGKCIGCRLEYSRQWANRCMLELESHENAYFCTFTYDNDNLPFATSINPDTGEIISTPTLVKRDFQLFMKRLRKAYTDNHIKYYCAGEYGSTTARPHYHAILYGLDIKDLEVYKRDQRGYKLYNSDWLNKIWKKGFVVIGDVTWDTCAYTARYIMKKQNGSDSKIYDDLNIEKEFSLISTKPAIGREYFDNNVDKFKDYDRIYLSTSDGGLNFRIPRYYMKLLEEGYVDDWQRIKDNRKIISDCQKDLKLLNTSLSYTEQLEVEEDIKKNRIKSLKRE